MKGELEVVKRLNKVLSIQLSAINQYFLHARILKDWGYEIAAKKIYKESITQMKLAEKTTDRILLIEGLPNYQKYLKLNIGEDVKEILKYDKEFCTESILHNREAAKLCIELKDYVTRDLLEKFVSSDESHLLWLEQQHHVISDIGLKNYLAEQI